MRVALEAWLAAALVSCAGVERPRPPEPTAAPPTVSTPAPETPPIACEGIGMSSSQLGHPLEPPPGTGIRSLEELASIPGIPVEIVWTSVLDGREVDWALRTGSVKAHGLWALRRVEGGWCVLGSFGSSDPVKAPMTLPAPTVLGTRLAVALLRIESLSEQRPETRHVALATDGRRLWLALAGQGGNQLVAREARLRIQGAKLLLEVQTSGHTRAVLKFDGTHFVPPD